MNEKFENKSPIGLRFSERMSGHLAEGLSDFHQGEKEGKKQKTNLSFDVTILIDNLDDFCKLSGRQARLEGTVTFKPLGRKLPIRNGVFFLFKPDPDNRQKAHDLFLCLYRQRRRGLISFMVTKSSMTTRTKSICWKI